MSAGKPCSRFTGPRAASLPRTSFTSSRDSRCGTSRRVPARSSTTWRSPAGIRHFCRGTALGVSATEACFAHTDPISMIRVTRETHETPAAIQERVARAGGTNRYGEPQFRVVWGGARLTWIGGKWTDRDANGNVVRETIEQRRVPKYLPENRWHVERWMPPESYGSPDEWYAQTVEVENGI